MFYLEHIETAELADENCTGQHNVKPVSSTFVAKCFDDSADAYDFSQNFGPEWAVVSYDD